MIAARTDNAVVLTDAVGRTIWVNDGFTRLTGYTFEEALDRKPGEILQGRDTDAATVARMGENLRQGLGFSEELVNYTKAGRRYWVSVDVQPIKDESGQVTNFMAIEKDITDRKQASAELLRAKQAVEESLREQEALIRLFIEHAPAALAMLDTELRLVAVSARWLTDFGLAEEELLGKRFHEVFATAPESWRNAHQRALNGETLGNEEESFIRPDGSSVWLKWETRPWFKADGAVGGIVIFTFDLTMRKLAEARNREALAMLDALEDAALIFEPRSLGFVYVNEGAARQLGFCQEELLQLTLPEIVASLDEAGLSRLLVPLETKDAQVRKATVILKRKDGSDYPAETTFQFLPMQGASGRFIALARDIRERLDQEKTERRAQRLESIGTLAGGIAHDLNNALAPIAMCVEHLKESYPDTSGLLDILGKSAGHATGMVRQLLNFAKGAEGERSEVSPKLLISEVKTIVESAFPKNFRATVRCAPNLPRVIGDATQLHQVLLNLCVNARDAMPKGGEIKIDASVQDVDRAFTVSAGVPDAETGLYVCLSVQDSGEGMPPEVLERIFDPFFTTKALDQGTGLGLSTVLGIVKGHGGFIRVDSTAGAGSEFQVYLPAVEKEEIPDTEDAPQKLFRGNGELILVLDDDPNVRRTETLVLEKMNFRVVAADDGEEGLVALAQHMNDIHASIVDMAMPNMDGPDFIRASKRFLPDLPVLAVSGQFTPRDRERLDKLGVTDTLAKPFLESELRSALENLLALSPH